MPAASSRWLEVDAHPPHEQGAGVLRFGSVGAVMGVDGGRPTSRGLPPAAVFWGRGWANGRRFCNGAPRNGGGWRHCRFRGSQLRPALCLRLGFLPLCKEEAFAFFVACGGTLRETGLRHGCVSLNAGGRNGGGEMMHPCPAGQGYAAGVRIRRCLPLRGKSASELARLILGGSRGKGG